MDIEYIRGYYDREKVVVNLGCSHGHPVLVSSFIRRRGEVIVKKKVNLASNEFYFNREHEKSGVTSK